MSENNTSLLPANWTRTTIGVVVEEKVSQTGPTAGDTFTYVDIGSIDNSTKRIVAPKALPRNEAPSRARQILARDDVLVSMTRPNLNAVAKVPRDLDGAVGSTGFHVLRTRIVEASWLYYTVQSNDFIQAMCQVVQGALYPAVRPRDIRSYTLPIPPLNEQRRIVAKIEELFSDLDAGVAALQRAKTNLKRYRAAVLKAAVEGRLTEQWRAENPAQEPASELLKRILKERRKKWEQDQLAAFEAKGKQPPKNWRDKYQEPAVPETANLPKLPEGWCWVTADQCTSMLTDGEHLTPPRTKEGVYLLSARNVLNGTLSLNNVDYISQETHESLERRLRIEPGDVLLSCSGTVGRSCVVPENIRFSLVRSVAVLKILFGMGQYFSYALRSSTLQSQIHRKKTQTAQANIFQSKIRTLVFPLPPLDEQQQITAELDEQLLIADRTEREAQISLVRSSRLRQSILKRAFEGKLVPQDPTDEPASVLLERIRNSAIDSGTIKGSRKSAVNTRRRAAATKETEISR